ncbi:MAG: CoA-binding protein [Syntrophaceae bacterium]|nr:CoA-binding protein [Syntrophaceae bacterium]
MANGCPDSMKNVLNLFFEPQGVAVVGSLREGYFGGYVVIKTMLNAGFTGKIYPVNPSYQEIHGLKVFPSIQQIPDRIDLALIMINRRTVPTVMRECVAKEIKAVIVVADGFAERDEEGAELQKEIVKIGREAGIRILGPNTAGVVNSANGFIPDPYEPGYKKVKPGAVAICAQTGMINPQAFPYADLHYGVSKICDYGNKCDVDECDLLEYLEGDSATKVITMYLEGIQDGQRFLNISKRVTPKKPVLILKSGRTKEGAKVSASHTGALAGDDQIFSAACKQSGILRIETFRQFFELPKIFSLQPLPKGNRLGIVTFTGGVGVLAIDEGTQYGLTVAKLSPEIGNRLDNIFPGLGKTVVDIGPPMAVNNYMTIYSEILQTVMLDQNIDCLFNVIWTSPFEAFVDEYLKLYSSLQRDDQKTIATWVYGPSLPLIRKLSNGLEDLGFPVFSDLETAIQALGMAYQYSTWKKGEK